MGTTTTNLALYKPAVGEVGWGVLVDGNFDTLDQKTGGVAAHGSLPSPAGVAVGSQFWCSTDKKPVWSDGVAHWVDATGANHT